MEFSHRDMLMRIDERTLAYKDDVAEIKSDIAEIKKVLLWIPCSVQKEKVRNLERITWGAMLLSFFAAIKAVLDLIFK